MNLRTQWVSECWRLAGEKADLYAGCRKILRTQVLQFELDDSLTLQDAGYTQSKLTMLRKNYFHAESHKIGRLLWEKRLGQAKYGSVGFTCYAHFVKGGTIDAKRSKRASVFGPCIQSVVLTWVDKRTTDVDVFYRTTELFKKFAPDLVFIRDVLLEGFPLSANPTLTAHFANITMHPMYAVTTFPHLPDPIATLNKLKHQDKYFYDWVIKWSARYLCPEFFRGIAKFSQAVRVQMDANKRLDKKTLKRLQKYVRDNHPGYRGDYVDPDEDE
jgi:hypothetical protein